jgi:probable addiction module antidote protein
MKDRSHDEAMGELFQEDPTYALELLNSVPEDGEPGELLIALRQMTKAFGGVQSVAEKANLNPTQLYRTLSQDGNPGLSSLAAILKAMGLHTCCRTGKGRLSAKGSPQPSRPLYTYREACYPSERAQPTRSARMTQSRLPLSVG